MAKIHVAPPSTSKTNDNGNVDIEDPNPKLSAYEKARAKNIVKNNARLRELGLISVLEEQKSNASAWDSQNNENDTTTRKRKAKSQPVKPKASPLRKSARLHGREPENTSLFPPSNEDDEGKRHLSKAEQRKAIVKECRQARQRAALRVMEDGAEKAARENPTATYEHCLFRVRTMTEKALRNRVKTIERATGKHCVVKMAIFKSCLQDEDMWELAEVASEALERLKALQAPSDEN